MTKKIVALLFALCVIMQNVVAAPPKHGGSGGGPAPLPNLALNGWSIDQWTYNFTDMHTIPADQIGAGTGFTFPDIDTQEWFTNALYKIQPTKASIVGKSYLQMTVSVLVTGSPTFDFKSEDGNTGTDPAACRFWIKGDTDIQYTGRWWSHYVNLPLGAQTGTILQVPIDGAAWSDANGYFGTDTVVRNKTSKRSPAQGFQQTLGAITQIGLQCGGGYFYGHGDATTGPGSATLELDDYSVH